MGLQQSKDQLLYKQVNDGNIEGIKALRREGAGLEWTDRERKTPLIVACSAPRLYNVAKTLIELGANVNAYCPGRSGGTPLHYAANQGLELTVKLLLSHGANALVMNDDFQTPLDVARVKGYHNIVRAIEGHMCLFSGWLRELHGPGLLELLAPQLLSRRVWIVVLPCGSHRKRKSFKLELAIYTCVQDAQPRTIIPLWKAKLLEPNFNQPDPAVIISDVSRIPRRWRKRRSIKSSQEARRTRIKLVPVHESEIHQLQQFSHACKGIPQVMHPLFPSNFPVPTAPATASQRPEDEELAMAINASLLSASHERPPHMDSWVGSGADASTCLANCSNSPSDKPSSVDGASASHMANGSKYKVKEAGPSGYSAQPFKNHNSVPSVVQTTPVKPSPALVPSAPPVVNAATDDAPVHYPSIDMRHVGVSSPVSEISGSAHKKEDDRATSSCTICLDAPVEGACIPCGHMVGCMSCLDEIKAKTWGCPVCRSQIDQVVRIYAV